MKDVSISMDNLTDVWLSNCGFDFCCGDDEEVEKEEKSIREKLEKLFAGHEKVTAINILSVDSAELLAPLVRQCQHIQLKNIDAVYVIET